MNIQRVYLSSVMSKLGRAQRFDRMGTFFLGESQSRIYPQMRAKFGRGPTVVSKKGGEYRHTHYDTFTSMSGTILPTMCQIVVVIQCPN